MGPKTKKTRPEKSHRKEICKDQVDGIISRRTFEPYSKPTIGCRFMRLKNPGENIIGQLGFPIRNFRQGTSYPLQLDNGEVVEIVGNRLLHKQIREGELCGQRVEIVYQGSEYTHYGHWRKVYRVFKVGYDQISKQEWSKIIAKAKRSKDGEEK